MTSRLLPREEWSKLDGTEAGPVWRQLPDGAEVVVVEQDGHLVGCHVLVSLLHAECVWIHPDHRGKASVARRLWASVQRTAREVFGADHVITHATDDRVRGLVAHLGGRALPGEAYIVSVRG